MTIVIEDLGIACGYEALTPDESTGITASVRQPTSGLFKGMMANAAIIVVENQAIRFRLDGATTAPTADAGLLMNANQNYTIKGKNNVKGFRCINTVAGTSSVKVQVFF